MNGITNTNTNTAVLAEVTPKATKTMPTIIARKSLMGKWKQTGAPPKPIIGLTVSPSRATFTKHDIFERNGRTVSLLTIDKRIKALVKIKKLCRLAEALKTDGPGRPSYRYSFDLSKAAPKRTRKAKVTAETTPAAETPAPVVAVEVAAPATAETVAQA